jgi:very-short-patch-repair endonuclease
MRHDGIYNVKSKQARRKELRNNATAAEAILWRALKGRQLNGKKFRRQHGIGRYIADFCCPECRVIVELDGKPHSSAVEAEYDAGRTKYLVQNGFTVLRFENRMVYHELEWVLEAIRSHLK